MFPACPCQHLFLSFFDRSQSQRPHNCKVRLTGVTLPSSSHQRPLQCCCILHPSRRLSSIMREDANAVTSRGFALDLLADRLGSLGRLRLELARDEEPRGRLDWWQPSRQRDGTWERSYHAYTSSRPLHRLFCSE